MTSCRIFRVDYRHDVSLSAELCSCLSVSSVFSDSERKTVSSFYNKKTTTIFRGKLAFPALIPVWHAPPCLIFSQSTPLKWISSVTDTGLTLVWFVIPPCTIHVSPTHVHLTAVTALISQTDTPRNAHRLFRYTEPAWHDRVWTVAFEDWCTDSDGSKQDRCLFIIDC